MAVGAIKRAKSLGLRVPEDISITGFDDIEICSIVEPGLTTVHVPHRDMGRTAAEFLFAALKHDNDGKSRRLDTYIVERQSLTAPDGP